MPTCLWANCQTERTKRSSCIEKDPKRGKFLKCLPVRLARLAGASAVEKLEVQRGLLLSLGGTGQQSTSSLARSWCPTPCAARITEASLSTRLGAMQRPRGASLGSLQVSALGRCRLRLGSPGLQGH